MIVFCFQCLKSLRIKTQVFCFQLLVILLIWLIFGICIFINYQYLKSLIMEIQVKIFSDIQIQRLNSQTSNIELQSQQYFINGYNQMEKINLFYQFSLNTNNLTLDDQSIHCPINLAIESNYSSKLLPYFCYAYYNSSHPFGIQENSQMVQFYNLLNQQLLRIGPADDQVAEYFSHKNETQFFAITPFIQYQSEYRPHIRPWYLNHLEQINISNKLFYISDIYLDYITKDQLITITRSLEDTNQQFQGVIAVDFTVESMQLLNHRNGILLKIDGQIIQQNNYFPSKVNDYIYDTQWTGYTKQDWEEIQKQVLYKNGVSNCKISSKGLCRNNKYYNQDLILDVFNLFDQFYLIMQLYVNLSFVDVEYLQDNQQLISNLQAKFFNNLVLQCIIFIIISIIFLAVTWFLMSLFLHPYTQLNQHTLESLYQKKNVIKNTKQTKDIYRLINLQNFTAKISQMKHTRSEECQKLEKFVYPRLTIRLPESVQGKFEQLSNLEDANIDYLSIYKKIKEQVEQKIEFVPNQVLIEEFKFQRQLSQ